MKPNILIIGLGDIGYPLAKTISDLNTGQVYVTRKDQSKGFGELEKDCYCGYDNVEFVKNAHIVVLAVRPSQLEAVLSEIKPYLRKNHVLISIVACKKIDFIKSIVGEEIKIVRAMPNIGLVGKKSMTFLAFDKKAENLEHGCAETLSSLLGEIQIIPEKQMNAGTVFTGSMPAIMAYLFRMYIQTSEDKISHSKEDYLCYVELVKRILAELAQEYGFENSKTIINQVYAGLYYLMTVKGMTFDQVIHAVATKGGCTEAILHAMEHGQGFGVMINVEETDFEELFKDFIRFNLKIGIDRLENM